MRVEAAKMKGVPGVSRKSRWAWSLCGALIVIGVLPGRNARAEAPADKAPVHTRGRGPAKSKQAKSSSTQAKARAKDAPKAVKKPNQPARRGTAHKPRVRKAARASKAPEEPELDVATGPDQACHVQLRNAGVAFVKISAERAPGVELPIRLTGDLAGIEIRSTGKNKVTSYLDCRLALALVRWVPQLKAAGVTGIDHYSMYRPDAEVSGTRKPSGHALALAIDAGRFHLSDGRVLTVLDSWTDKTQGADPCTPRPLQSADERLLRELVCDASRRGIFQTVVTPHHNLAHSNHVHLEVSGSFAPTWIH
jgi:hypothetical protein